jgi:hypothetical protein
MGGIWTTPPHLLHLARVAFVVSGTLKRAPHAWQVPTRAMGAFLFGPFRGGAAQP